MTFKWPVNILRSEPPSASVGVHMCAYISVRESGNAFEDYIVASDRIIAATKTDDKLKTKTSLSHFVTVCWATTRPPEPLQLIPHVTEIYLRDEH